MKSALKRLGVFLTLFALALGNLLMVRPAQASTSGTGINPKGSCTGHACDDDDSCPIPFVWKHWWAIKVCSWGVSGCDNNVNFRCYTKYNTPRRCSPLNESLPGSDFDQDGCKP